MTSVLAFSSSLPLSSSQSHYTNTHISSRRASNSDHTTSCAQNPTPTPTPTPPPSNSDLSRRAFFTNASKAVLATAFGSLALSTPPANALIPHTSPLPCFKAYFQNSGPSPPKPEPTPVGPKKFALPPLPYAYDALEPNISEKIMRAHHDAHFAAYVNNLNAAMVDLPRSQRVWDDVGLRALLANLESVADAGVRTRLRNNGGGYLNHKFFFAQMAATPRDLPADSPLAASVRKRFGTLDRFKDEFLTSSGKLFGSGFTWLVVDSSGAADIVQTPNQDNPAMKNQIPVLACDCWEHSWYYQYGPSKKEYFSAWWKVIDWPTINDAYVNASSSA